MRKATKITKATKKVKATQKAEKGLIPPDVERCQALRPNGYSFMTLGGIPGLERCTNRPIVIAIETKPAKDGKIGSMSLCSHCMNKLLEQEGHSFATFEAIEREDH